MSVVYSENVAPDSIEALPLPEISLEISPPGGCMCTLTIPFAHLLFPVTPICF